jgi:hypothetical protein
MAAGRPRAAAAGRGRASGAAVALGEVPLADASLAVILHVIDSVDAGVGGPVSGVAAERAAAWCRYLEGHARRLYATVTDRVRVGAALLASRLARGRLASPFTAREVYRNDWTGLTDPRWWGGAGLPGPAARSQSSIRGPRGWSRSPEAGPGPCAPWCRGASGLARARRQRARRGSPGRPRSLPEIRATARHVRPDVVVPVVARQTAGDDAEEQSQHGFLPAVQA